MHLELSPMAWYSLPSWKSWKLEEDPRSFKLQHSWDRPEYWEESWKLKEICCRSVSSERLSAEVGVKNSQGMTRVLTSGPKERCSIPGRMVLDVSLLIIRHYKVRIKSKSSNSGKGVAPSPIPRCCNYWKGSLRVTLDYDRLTTSQRKINANCSLLSYLI